jgi:hypothetical protein
MEESVNKTLGKNNSLSQMQTLISSHVVHSTLLQLKSSNKAALTRFDPTTQAYNQN